MDTEDEIKGPDRTPWIICPVCEGEGKSSAYLGDFTMSDFRETFEDEDDQQAYFDGAYDRTCDVCCGSGKIRESQMDLVYAHNERERIARTGRNSAGEPC